MKLDNSEPSSCAKTSQGSKHNALFGLFKYCVIFSQMFVTSLVSCFFNLQGEAYKLIWPDQPEFVRMAARFGATIVPFGTVGEDDIAEVSFEFYLHQFLIYINISPRAFF